MNQTQKSPAPVAAGSEAQYQNKHPDYSAILAKTNDSARLRRAVDVLLKGPVNRRDLDAVIGTTNAPAYVSRLKDLGLWIDCETLQGQDRYGQACRYGRYHLSQTHRDGLRHALTMQGVKL
ncbi:hypothetical protein [uncultured Alcanivorax sp.]|uniref:hypothetical protein n=1 Tax=uncultured Alcanivorax sp. TaxID=191215 RepID=UPI0025DAC692|nr:hypothetical protein [uncultured Alcanivorax sp.]